MPNWIMTRLFVEGPEDAVEDFCRTMIVDDSFTFEGILPMPKILRETTKGTTSAIGGPLLDAVAAKMVEPHPAIPPVWLERMVGDRKEPFYVSAERYLDNNPEYRTDAELCRKAKAETGFEDWYEWSYHNWGTKWDACHSSVNEKAPGYVDISFDTAWSFAEPVFDALVEAYPTLTFSGSWQDECEDEAHEFNYHKGL